jgi:hypothetical protein
MPRRYVIAQFPNRPLLLALAGAAVSHATDGATARHAATAARVALLWWSYEELTSGVNAFRRLLGAGAGAYCVTALARARPAEPANLAGPR